MKLSSFIFLILLVTYGYSRSDIQIGHQVTVAVPTEYVMGFIGRAFLIETDQMTPNFRVAMSVEAINGKYSCSLQVFLGDVKVWDSGHYSHFYTSDKCILELTLEGDLRLKGPKERVGWKTGTSGQGVERLQLLRTGNLVLVDVLDHIKWQSFHFPTDVMLWGQRLDVATRLTSFLSNSSEFYSFEVQNNKIALYLNSGKLRYSYWEFNPSKNRSINFVELSASGLELFNEKYKKMGQIPSQGLYPLRFLALKNETGNFGLYFYSPDREKFEASFQALNSTCDLPMSCKAYGICTFSSTCACLPLPTKENKGNFSCNSEISGGFCSDKQAEMLELEGVSSVLKDDPKMVNISREACENLCLEDCKCAAALYSSGKEASDIQQCFLYRLVMGLKQVEKGDGFSYMIKVPKGTGGGHGRSSLKKWVLVVVGVVDGLIILLVVGGLGYYFMQKRRKNSSHSDGNTS